MFFREPRSLLFVPADSERLIAKAASRGADLIVLDLEDGVAPLSKVAARASLSDNISKLQAQGATVYVRVNNDSALLKQDVFATVQGQADGIVLPKTESPEQLVELGQLSTECGVTVPVALIAILETPAGVCDALKITKSTPRLRGVIFGSEDFATAMSVAPTVESLAWSASAVAVAAVAAGVQPIGLAGTVANFVDMSAYREIAVRSRQFGMRGSICIHPAQVAVLNEVFGDSDVEIAKARQLVDAFEAAVSEGRGVIAVNGRMVDEPVAQRARQLIQRNHDRISKP